MHHTTSCWVAVWNGEKVLHVSRATTVECCGSAWVDQKIPTLTVTQWMLLIPAPSLPTGQLLLPLQALWLQEQLRAKPVLLSVSASVVSLVLNTSSSRRSLSVLSMAGVLV